MSSIGPAAVPAFPARIISRGGLFARIGAVIVGATAASILATQQKAAAHPPVCCVGGHHCWEYGCSSCPQGVGRGTCCWWCQGPSCKMYQCCDQTCGSNGCICANVVCSGCC
jgi:hypothetical protein